MLDALIRTVVGTAKSTVISLLPAVTIETPGKADGFGASESVVTRTANAQITEHRKVYRRPDGGEVISSHRLLFVENIVIGGADIIRFADGTSGAILDIAGIADPLGGRFTTTVVIGVDVRVDR